MRPPDTERDDLVETLHGHRIADPYRWLEDPDSDRTRAWVAAQRDYFESVFATIGHRDWFTATMNDILRQPRIGAPSGQHGWFLRRVRDADQDQEVLVGARSLDDLLTGGRVLLDPNQWSDDGTTSLGAARVSPDGRLLAHGISEAGSDWTRIAVLDLDTGQTLPDEVMARFSQPNWLGDSSGFLYTAFPEAGRAEGTETRAVAGGHLMLHRIGTDASSDLDLLSFPDDPHLMMVPVVLEGAEHDWVVLMLRRGTHRSNALWVAPVLPGQGAGAGDRLGDWTVLFDDHHHERLPVGVIGDELLLQVNDHPLGEVIAVPLPGAAGGRRVVIGADEHVLADVALADGLLLTHHLADAQPLLRRWTSRGDLLGVVGLDAGALVGLTSEPKQPDVFLAASSTVRDLTAWHLDIGTGDLTQLPAAERGWQPPQVTVRRGRAASTPARTAGPHAPGVQVPFFLITADDAPPGPRPTLLYGYGGFSVPVAADYRPGWPAWLAAGGTLVIANLRGGSEYGNDWYEQGRAANKQNVFDDVIAVAEHLIATGVTTPAQLAIHGRSNGGLLVGAAMSQRPELFAAAIPQVGVLDLLRFHRFTIGAAWTSDYGNPEVTEDFETALAYSPLHNLRRGTEYPATLVVTGDHDDRVVPAHSHKFTATLQAAQGDAASPAVTRIEVATGHGIGKPVGMLASEWADVLAFAAHHTGLVPPPRR
ncbi:S9 family peptidase [Tessaracoccus sp. SD287]|uniref:prolyl oligopeptidase family serine peptidase n=1 Tax=Tessaracoccus sp. SD287 TaxID=2782008 RepID=UPI001A962277|nr:prolyl oligopeptidase family serine peptidase [Tessaracoccus sp. SD287]MBO1031987.1 S9 family peptidase [Tessaracoccus sp. SD287]